MIRWLLKSVRMSTPGPTGVGSRGEATVRMYGLSATLVAPVLPHLGAIVTTPVFRHVFQRDLERLRDLVESGTA